MENYKKPEKSINTTKKRPSSYMLFEAGIEFAVMIGLPLYLFILLGKWLDNKFKTSYLILVCILAALSLSVFMVYKKINYYKNLLK